MVLQHPQRAVALHQNLNLEAVPGEQRPAIVRLRLVMGIRANAADRKPREDRHIDAARIVAVDEQIVLKLQWLELIVPEAPQGPAILHLAQAEDVGIERASQGAGVLHRLEAESVAGKLDEAIPIATPTNVDAVGLLLGAVGERIVAAG